MFRHLILAPAPEGCPDRCGLSADIYETQQYCCRVSMGDESLSLGALYGATAYTDVACPDPRWHATGEHDVLLCHGEMGFSGSTVPLYGMSSVGVNPRRRLLGLASRACVRRLSGVQNNAVKVTFVRRTRLPC